MNWYKQLADHLYTLLTTKVQLKSLVYGKQFKLNVAASYSLLSTCLNNIQQFQLFKEQVESSSGCEVGNPYLFWVMLAELINKGSIKGGGKVKRMIVDNQQLLPAELRNGRAKKINKHHIQIRLVNGRSVELTGAQPDKDIPNLYDLAYEDYSLLRANSPAIFTQPGIVVQSKSSCLPPFVLFQGLMHNMDKFDNFDIIDCCAAPGNKTMQLAQYLGRLGKVYAFDKDPKRAALLEHRVSQQHFKNIVVSNQDFLSVAPTQRKYSKVKLILADPSCSGSGMLINIERDVGELSSKQWATLEEYEQEKWKGLPSEQQQRIIKLQEFQLNILNHCAQFQPLRIVYSTCSIFTQQNEEVVAKFLQANPAYQIKPIRGLDGIQRGQGPIGKHCLRISPLSKETDGFFVCLLKRRSL